MSRFSVAFALVFAITPALAGAGEPKLKAEDVLARSLSALGPVDRAQSARTLQGTCAMSSPASGATAVAGALPGQFTFASSTTGFRLGMQFPVQGYPAETFAFQGDKPEVAFVQPGHRSAVGHFLSTNDVILREGLLGGVLSADWPLLSLAERGAKLRYDGLKKLDNRELHRLSYRAKKGQDTLDVWLFFEPETFRHAATVYRKSQAQSMGATIEQSSRESDMYFTLEETFGEWKTLDGLVLPTSWTMRYEMQARQTQYWKYEMQVQGAQK